MIEFKNLSKKKIDYRIFRRIYKKIFGKEKYFELSVVFAGREFMWRINRKYRRKDQAANVLAFPMDMGRGEIFLNAEEKDTPYLFTHGCLHLLGYGHETKKEYLKMRRKEKELIK